MSNSGQGYLSHLKVLDLTDHRGVLAGRIFAQMGAEVVQIEPREGTDSRRQAPFAPSGASLYWAAYGAGRKSLALDLKKTEDYATFLKLVEQADILVESGNPAEQTLLDGVELSAANPRLIHCVVTPYGVDGPKSDYLDSELTLWAAGGPLLPVGAVTQRPFRISVPQAYHHAAMDAVQGALVAMFARDKTGRGQRVEVSAQTSATQSTLSMTLAGAVGHPNYTLRKSVASMKKQPDLSGSGARTAKSKWQCQDGLIELHLAIGPATGRFTNQLFKYLQEAGAEGIDEFAAWDWSTLQDRIMADELDDDDLERARQAVGKFLARFNKQDTVDIALKYKVLMAPVMTVKDLIDNPQTKARDFMETVPFENREIMQPGPFAQYRDDAFVKLGAAPEIDADAESVRREWLREAPPVPAPATAQADDVRPLEGIKVLDLAWVVAGPMIGRNLADFGATVVRVESSKRIETARMLGPYPGGEQDFMRSGQFENCNSGKLGLSLDLGTQEARDVILDLVEWADVVVESFAPGQIARWGLGYEELKKRNPSVIMLSTSLMGQTGPWSKLAGFGNIGGAMSGYQGLVGPEDGLPVGPYGPYTDYVGPRFGLIALLAALDHRAKTGEGGRMDVSQSETGMQSMMEAFADYDVNGVIATAIGNKDPLVVPNDAFPCRKHGHDDRWIAISCRTDEEWRRLAAEIGGDLAADDSLATVEGRKAAEARIYEAIAAWTREQDDKDVEVRLQKARVPAHVAASSEDIFADPQIRHQGHFVSIDRPDGIVSTVEACRFILSETPAKIERASPDYGRDNDYVLSEILNYPPKDIEKLQASGALV